MNHQSILLYNCARNAYLKQIQARISKKPGLSTGEISSPSAACMWIEETGPSLIIAAVSEFAEARDFLKFLRQSQDMIEAGKLRAMAMVDVQSPRAHKLLDELGCEDILPMNLIWEELEKKILESLAHLQRTKFTRLPTLTDEFAPELTNKISIRLGTVGADDARLLCGEMIEFNDDSLVLEISSCGFRVGQDVIALVTVDSPAQDPAARPKMKAAARISEITPTDNNRVLVSLSIPPTLNQFLESSRRDRAEVQTRIHDFLKAARGW